MLSSIPSPSALAMAAHAQLMAQQQQIQQQLVQQQQQLQQKQIQQTIQTPPQQIHQQAQQPNAQPSSPIDSGFPQGSSASNRIYVGSIFFDLNEEDVISAFSGFGTIKSCQLIRDPATGKHKGYGFIEFETVQSATNAMAQMNNFELAGRRLKVAPATAAVAPTVPPNPLLQLQSLISAQLVQSPAQQAIMAANAAALKLQGLQPSAGVLAAGRAVESLQKEENIRITDSNQRLMVMQQLNREQTSPSRCIILRNMVLPSDVDDDLKTEVTEECGKSGQVDKVVIYTDHEASLVKIFVLFNTVAEATRGLRSMANRWFGGRVIKADFYSEDRFNACDYTG
eukprot:c9070_g1_i1.p1 GENE.c9070_g1_i1~~c9070_g1_i1.p1  ORF type:complete len:340 (-),score=83.38 c9070_g1_i1:33-1052(-)